MNLVWRNDFETGPVVWTLVATVAAIVLSWPGLTLFYYGLLRKQDPVAIARLWPSALAVLGLTWSLWTYSLAFAPSWGSRPVPDPDTAAPMATSLQELMAASAEPIDPSLIEGGGGVIGGTDFMALRGLAPQSSERDPLFPALMQADHLPHLLFATFHMMLFVVAATPLLVLLTGRVRPVPTILFAAAWGTLVYAPLAHAIWGRGWLEELGALDSGGGLLQVGIGFSALACLFVRDDRPFGRDGDSDLTGPFESEPSSRWVFSAHLGAVVFWGGALVVHPAATLSPDGAATIALFNTQLAACGGLVAWVVTDWFIGRRVTPFGPAAGAMAGIAAVAAGCGLMVPQSALLVGIGGGVLGSLSYRLLRMGRARSGPLAVLVIQGITGALGMLLAGVFVTSSVAGVRESGEAVEGLIEGDAARLGFQSAAVAAAAAYSFAATALCLLPICLIQARTARRRSNEGGSPVAESSA